MLYKITNRSKVRLFYSRLNALKFTPRNINQWLNINQLCATFHTFLGQEILFHNLYEQLFCNIYIFFFSVWRGGEGREITSSVGDFFSSIISTHTIHTESI